MRDPEKERERGRAGYWNNREKQLARCRRWARANPEKVAAKARRYYWNNLEKARAKCRRWGRANPEKKRKNKRRWLRAHPDANRTVHARVGSAVRKSLKRAKASPKAFGRWRDLLGYTMKELENNLKRKIPKGYAWRDYIDGKLHLDHKIPISAFNIKSAEDLAFKACWSLKNLQLLPARDNIAKGSKIDGHFQAFLPIKRPLKVPWPGDLDGCNPTPDP